VKDGARFVVTDARADARVPQELVERYGIRSYVGAPVRIGGTVVGSLCAIDHEPREFGAGDLALLDELARRASVRMEELALSSDGLTDTLLTRASTPAFSELRNLMLPLAGNISLARTALADIGSLVRLWFDLPPELRRAAEHTAPALGSLDGASRAWADLATVIDDLEVVEQRLRPIVVSLEQLVLPADEPAVGNIVETASHLAHQRLKIVGGVQWQVDSCATTVTTPRMLAVSTLAAALSLTASGMRAGQAGAMKGHVRCEPADVVFALGADGFDPTWALRRLQTLLRGTPEIGLAASADQLMLRMPRAVAGR